MRLILRRLLLPVIAALSSAPAWATLDCKVEAFRKVAPEGTEIVSAQRETAGKAAFCEVEGTMATIGHRVRFRIGLPEDWNGKFLFEAVGGGAGILVDVAPAVKRGYAVATTDTGHEAFPGDFAFWHDENQRTDWVHRAVHTVTVGAKTLVQAFYAKPPQYALLRGCSNGGRAGLMEAQRYPEDYDGILSAAPAADAGTITLTWMWNSQVLAATPVSNDDWKLVGRTVRAACDGKDGLVDGLIQDGRRCDLPRAQLACTAERNSGCLDAAKLAAVEKIWTKPMLSDGQILPAEGRGYEDETPAQFFYAGASQSTLLGMLLSPPEMGNDFETRTPEGMLPLGVILPMLFFGTPSVVEQVGKGFAQGVLLPPGRTVDVRSFDIVKDGPQLAKEVREVVDLTHCPDLMPYLRRGSKLLMWHGMADTTLAPGATFAYFDLARENAMQAGMSAEAFDQSVRLYTSPTTGHCTDGSGPNESDLLGALDQWVTTGKTPQSITSVRRDADGKVVRARPMCPMPQEPQYLGKGSIDEAASFVCAVPPDRVGMTGLSNGVR